MAVGKSVRHKTKTIKKAGSKHKVLKRAFHTWPLPVSTNSTAVLQSLWSWYYTKSDWASKPQSVECRIEAVVVYDTKTVDAQNNTIPGTNWMFSIRYHTRDTNVLTMIVRSFVIDRVTGVTHINPTYQNDVHYNYVSSAPFNQVTWDTQVVPRTIPISLLGNMIAYLLQANSTEPDPSWTQISGITWSGYTSQRAGQLDQSLIALVPGPIGYMGATPMEIGRVSLGDTYVLIPRAADIPLNAMLDPIMYGYYNYGTNISYPTDPNYVSGSATACPAKSYGVEYCNYYDGVFQPTSAPGCSDPGNLYMPTHIGYADYMLLNNKKQWGLQANNNQDYWQEVILP